MKNATLLLCLLLFGYTNAQRFQLSPEVKELAEPLDTISIAQSSCQGIACSQSKYFSNLQKIDSIATEGELFRFAIHGSNALRFFGAQALVERKSDYIYSLYNYYLNNPLKVYYSAGCIVRRVDIAENMVSTLERIKSLRSDKEECESKKNKSDHCMNISTIMDNSNYTDEEIQTILGFFEESRKRKENGEYLDDSSLLY